MYDLKTFMILDCNNEVDIFLLLDKTTVSKWYCTTVVHLYWYIKNIIQINTWLVTFVY